MGKGLGAGGLEKQDAFPLTRAIFTQGLRQPCSVPPAPGWESPWKTSSLPQQHPGPAKHSLKPELLRRPVCQQPRGSTRGPSTAGTIQQWMRWLLARQETAVAAVGPGRRPAGAPGARRTPPGLQGWMAHQGPNACNCCCLGTFQGSWENRGPGVGHPTKWTRGVAAASGQVSHLGKQQN